MVKGVSKQAVIIPSPDPKKFEQAIFIVSGEAEHGIGSANEMLDLACQLASRYTVPAAPLHKASGSRSASGRLRRTLVPVFSFLLGSGATALVWSLLLNT